MRNGIFRFSLLAILAITGCTQPPAIVELRGQQFFGRDTTVAQMAAAAPASGIMSTNTNDQTVAAPASITAHDLTPPAKTAAVTPTAKPIASTPVNPWTHAPRVIEERTPPQEAAEVKKSATAPKKQTLALVVPPVHKESVGFIWPVASKTIVSSFGPKGSGIANDGINIASKTGEPVWASADGEVIYAGNELKGYGNMVIIKHSGGKSTTYAHLSRISTDKYARVKQGDVIGRVGKTGDVKEPQLHFAVRDGTNAVDPLKYLKRNVASAE